MSQLMPVEVVLEYYEDDEDERYTDECPACFGSGYEPGNIEPCHHCEGECRVPIVHPITTDED